MTQIHYDDLNVQKDPRDIRCYSDCPFRLPPRSSGESPKCFYLTLNGRPFSETVSNSNPCKHPEVFSRGKTLSIDIIASLQESSRK